MSNDYWAESDKKAMKAYRESALAGVRRAEAKLAAARNGDTDGYEIEDFERWLEQAKDSVRWADKRLKEMP